MALTTRNLKETMRDPLSLALTIALPAVLLLIFQTFGRFDEIFQPTQLTPGIVVFGFVMVMFSGALLLAKDRETALFSRMLTAPLSAGEFVTGYALPYLPVALVQAAVLFGIGAVLGMEINGSFWLVLLLVLVTAILFIGLAMVIGALFSSKQVPFAYTAILLLAIFGGAWMNLDAIGGGFAAVGNWFPFAHALDAMRDVMVQGVGFGAIATDFYWLVGYTVVIGMAGVFAFRSRMVE